MFKIISKKRYDVLLEKEATLHDVIRYSPRAVSNNIPRKETILNCGYKSCQFQTTDPKGLKIHRTRIHKKK